MSKVFVVMCNDSVVGVMKTEAAARRLLSELDAAAQARMGRVLYWHVRNAAVGRDDTLRAAYAVMEMEPPKPPKKRKKRRAGPAWDTGDRCGAP